jgi:hypothetical protein
VHAQACLWRGGTYTYLLQTTHPGLAVRCCHGHQQRAVGLQWDIPSLQLILAARAARSRKLKCVLYFWKQNKVFERLPRQGPLNAGTTDGILYKEGRGPVWRLCCLVFSHTLEPCVYVLLRASERLILGS